MRRNFFLGTSAVVIVTKANGHEDDPLEFEGNFPHSCSDDPRLLFAVHLHQQIVEGQQQPAVQLLLRVWESGVIHEGRHMK